MKWDNMNHPWQQQGASGRPVTLAAAVIHVQRVFPGAYYAPQRWKTVDGVMPYRVLWAYFTATQVAVSLDKLTMATAIGLAMGGEQGQDRAEQVLEEAYP